MLTAIADYVLGYAVESQPAHATALQFLKDSLTRGFQALKIPACTQLLGPVVPGATLAGGARVPGTSYELDPVNAAFNIAITVGWPGLFAPAPAADWGHPSDNLGGILAVADYLSRSGGNLKMRDVLTAVVKAHEIQGALAAGSIGNPVTLDRVLRIRVATAAVVTGLLGGTREGIVDAVSQAYAEGGIDQTIWAAADATSRGVRLALFALKLERGDFASVEKPLPLARPLGCHWMENWRSTVSPEDYQMADSGALGKNFESSIGGHFKQKQAEVIGLMFADRTAFAALPVSSCIARLVSA